MQSINPQSSDSVLDVGVTSDTDSSESNFFEQWYPFTHRITCVGVEDASHLTRQYEGITFAQIQPHQPLPFPDKSFDIVFSNAVVEHAGSRSQQKFFISELCRVSKRFFISAPYRWFPVEHHTGLPLLHYLPQPLFRRLIASTRYKYWSNEEHLNLLSMKDLCRLFPPDMHPQKERIDIFGLTANIIVFGESGFHEKK